MAEGLGWVFKGYTDGGAGLETSLFCQCANNLIPLAPGWRGRCLCPSEGWVWCCSPELERDHMCCRSSPGPSRAALWPNHPAPMPLPSSHCIFQPLHTQTQPSISIFLKRLICDSHLYPSPQYPRHPWSDQWHYPWENYRSPKDVPDIMLVLSTFYSPLPNSVLASKISMQDLQEGLVPPDHCIHTTGRKGEIFLPAGSACVKTGERGKGKCDLHRAISDCPSWGSKPECFAKQAFILTSSIYWLYHIGLY